ncbi:MAG: hypothetical protein WCJ35_16475 [Planctomycetota bacterium]
MTRISASEAQINGNFPVPTSAIALILSRLSKPERNSSGWQARCPAHRDSNPSLAVTLGADGRVLLHCFAGCSVEDVVQAIGLKVQDLFPRLQAGCRDPQAQPAPWIATAVAQATAQPPDWIQAMCYLRGNLTRQPEMLNAFADNLGLPVEALPCFGLGYGGDLDPFMAIPEDDGTGRIIGIQRRYPDGRKLMIRGSHRGLVVPNGWATLPGPVFVPEGFSDTVALISQAVPAIGRPAARGGVELLATTLGTVNRNVIVLGENDEKPDGTWIGRDAAIDVARELTERLKRHVRWAMPPEGYKDVRDSLTGRRCDHVQN